MKKAFLSLGTNLGDKEKNLSRAIRYINVGIGQMIDLSGLYETEPWGFESNEKFLNMVIEIVTDLTPLEMIDKCLEIENKLGRIRKVFKGYSSRTIDIDILFYDDIVLSEANLILPHPHIQNRRFILEPLCEIAPDFIHPVLNKTLKELLIECTDICIVKQLGSISSGF
ncbi:MAG: 2-amino-4-hydroxy-6-hydroxymethyldihydropteridine diphosphokinase [Prolixibacteraceae bacterium]|jgi:2-amino-4-hydroxy-6-hydroxymethyldihydropteridine diphosphokinase|nr:2-amino-4-hydroxy-6-hydroxymethyldihydropteridine diphosphokinase [Prolixibacteraceae bacterium]